MKTSEAARASATGAGGSEPSAARGDMPVTRAAAPACRGAAPRARRHDGEDSVGPGLLRRGPQALAEILERLVGDHDDVLVGLDVEAPPDDGLDGAVEIAAHGRFGVSRFDG